MQLCWYATLSDSAALLLYCVLLCTCAFRSTSVAHTLANVIVQYYSVTELPFLLDEDKKTNSLEAASWAVMPALLQKVRLSSLIAWGCGRPMQRYCSRATVRVSKVRIRSNQIKFICDTNQNITECDIVIRQMCRQDTKAVATALTGALGSKKTNYNSKWRQH